MIVGATPPADGATGPLYVMALADRRADWAATRQAAIAGNIANADTPGYKARDIEPFEAREQKTRLQLTVTRQDHMALSPLEMRAAQVEEAEAWDVTHSANTVSVDEELMKSGETERHHRMALTVLGSFHRMLIDSVSFR
jgi:flagellar basal-body rod protein FlgB